MTFTPDLLFFVLATIIIASLMIVSWQYRHTNSGRYFLMLMSCALVWVLFFIFETAINDMAYKLFFVKIEFLGIMFLPYAWVLLIVNFTGKSLPKQINYFLLVIPILSTIVLWTNPIHHWFIGTPSMITSGVPFPVLNLDYQFWFYDIHAPAGYLYLAISFIILLRYMVRTEPVYKLQTRMLLIAILLPTVTDMLYVFGITPISHYNFTTAVFSISGIILFWTLFRFQFLDLLPLARDMVIDKLSDGVLVLDYKMRLVYANQSAKNDFRLNDQDTGQAIASINNPCVRQIKLMLDAEQNRKDIDSGEQSGKFFDISLSPVFTNSRVQIGYVATAHDVTDRVRLFNQAHTLSIQDSLTGISNRRHFFAACNRELDRINQHKEIHSDAIMMIDLDDFKQINDTYGHAVGDKMLINIASAIQTTLRRDDLFGRLGGDEFSIMLLDVENKESMEIAERIRKTIHKVHLIQNEKEISVTASIGIVHTDQILPEEMEIEKILQLADQALYQGKATGKNRIQQYQHTV